MHDLMSVERPSEKGVSADAGIPQPNQVDMIN